MADNLERFSLLRAIRNRDSTRIREISNFASYENKPLHEFTHGIPAEIAQMMLEAAADVNSKDPKTGNTLLHILATIGGFFSLETINVLIKFKADVNIKNNEGQAPLQHASAAGDLQVVAALIEAGAEVQSQDKHGVTPIHEASENGHSKVVDLLLKSGADVHCKNLVGKPYENSVSGQTPLHKASANGRVETVKILIQAEAKIESQDMYGQTPLHYASNKGHNEVVKVLLELGANVNIKDLMGKTPLYVCSTYETINILLKAGADVECKDNSTGKTVLHVAATNGNSKVVELLLDFGANIDSKDRTDKTPLFCASANSNRLTLELLLKRGADINVVSDTLNTALDYPLLMATRQYHTFATYVKDLAVNTEIVEDSEELLTAEKNSHDACIDALQNHIVKMKAARMYLVEDSLKVHSRNANKLLKSLARSAELAKMKVEQIHDSNVTYLNFLRKNVHQLVLMFENEKIVKFLRTGSYRNEFPIFANLISSQFHKGLYRLKLVNRVKGCDGNAVFKGLLEDCVNHILTYFNNEELISFAKSFDNN